MKLKYYLRGLGVGIVAMGLIMIITSLNHKTMSDEEVVQRARELGMEYSTTLNNMKTEETTEEDAQSEAPDEKEDIKAQDNEAGDANVADADAKADENGDKPSEEDAGLNDNAESNEGADEGAGDTENGGNAGANGDATGNGQNDGNTDDGTEEYVVLTISPGDGSDKLSSKAAELGLVESAADLDNYLITNGYANRLRVGSYEIKVGSSYEEIVNAIFN